MKLFFKCILVVFALFFVVGQAEDASARKPKHSKSRTKVKYAPYNPMQSAFVVDADTGKILYQENADQFRHPASLTKMMTLYLTFEALSAGKITMDTEMPISREAASRPQTNLSLQAGDTISVRDAILGAVIRSANDAAVVLAEYLGGTEDNFAKIMTQRARQLGMKHTTFVNASGLHDPKQITSAKDLALLAIALKRHYPEYFHFFSRTEFDFKGTTFTGHNRVMMSYPGADGLKTGFVTASGFNLVTTANRRGTSLVGVVLGGRSAKIRDDRMVDLLDKSFLMAENLKSQRYISQPASGANAYKPKQAEAAPANPNPVVEAKSATTIVNNPPSNSAYDAQSTATGTAPVEEMAATTANAVVPTVAAPMVSQAVAKSKRAKAVKTQSKKARVISKTTKHRKKLANKSADKSNIIVYNNDDASAPPKSTKLKSQFVPQPKGKPSIGVVN